MWLFDILLVCALFASSRAEESSILEGAQVTPSGAMFSGTNPATLISNQYHEMLIISGANNPPGGGTQFYRIALSEGEKQVTTAFIVDAGHKRMGNSYICANFDTDYPDLSNCFKLPFPSGGWFVDLNLKGSQLWIWRDGPGRNT